MAHRIGREHQGQKEGSGQNLDAALASLNVGTLPSDGVLRLLQAAVKGK